MLVNVKFYKIFTIFILLSVNLSADEKDQIVTQLNNLNSLEFTFDQIINDKTEKGSCLLEFPGKLKCDYFDDKKKELIINNVNAPNKNGFRILGNDTPPVSAATISPSLAILPVTKIVDKKTINELNVVP